MYSSWHKLKTVVLIEVLLVQHVTLTVKIQMLKHIAGLNNVISCYATHLNINVSVFVIKLYMNKLYGTAGTILS